jgi:acetylornithine deacetylase/succinyl-diaminopimelate desuccinylase family protein
MSAVTVNELSGLLGRLVSIDSVNPDLVPGANGERDVASFVAAWLREHGLEVHVEEALYGRPNVVAVARGTGGGKSLMLNAHMDTVGVSGMKSPFQPHVRNNRLYARGALDTKGALAAFMLATARAADMKLRGDVILTAVIDEEYASAGTEAAIKKWRADGAIVGEPTNLEIVIAHKGFAWFEFETYGEAAHGSRPDLGVDAIVKMGKVLAGIEQMAERLARSKPHPLLGTGSVHASIIEGGQEFSSYPSLCKLSVERRTLPGEDIDAVEAEMRGLLDAISRSDPEFRGSVTKRLARGPLEVPADATLVQTLAEKIRLTSGRPAKLAGMSGWMDSALLAGAGIPSVIFGPAGEGLHADVEWVDLASVARCHEVVLATISDFCK